ncbi:hypothetical protein Vafri_216 [Volvox africanus]|nr:hypothetical protein Vafri_216 [Volvox africanus]
MLDPAVNSLIFDFEAALPVDEGAKPGSIDCAHDANLVVQRLETLCRASCPFARELRCNVQRMLMANCDKECEDVVYLARCLASLGYIVSVRLALPGTGADCFKSLRHEFLVVLGTGEFHGMEFIVEPSLRQHFAIPHPSPDYESVLSRTPDVFVGGSCRLVSIIQLLCALMADSFQREGLPLPPWRREAAMLSKWLPHPARTRDRPVLPAPTNTAAASPICIPAPGDGADLAAAAPAAAAAISCDCFRAPSDQTAAQEGFSDLLPTDLRVCPNDSSDASTDSSGGFASCVPLEGSPVSVLRLPGVVAAAGCGGKLGEAEAVDQPPMRELSEDLAAAFMVRKNSSAIHMKQHPHEVKPLAPGHRSASAPVQVGPAEWAESDLDIAAPASADGAIQARAPILAPAPFEHHHQAAKDELRQTDAHSARNLTPETSLEGLPLGAARRSDEYNSGCSWGDDARARTSEDGIEQCKVRQIQKHPPLLRPAAAAAPGRICTRPPLYRGEMAIRVVKLVGFSISGSLERHRLPAPQPQLHQQWPVAPVNTIPSRAVALTGTAAGASGRDLRNSWKARQRAL